MRYVIYDSERPLYVYATCSSLSKAHVLCMSIRRTLIGLYGIKEGNRSYGNVRVESVPRYYARNFWPILVLGFIIGALFVIA